jgi:hypothetical protein
LFPGLWASDSCSLGCVSTAETIFRIKDPHARNIVMELGFGNVSMAPLALLSFYRT